MNRELDVALFMEGSFSLCSSTYFAVPIVVMEIFGMIFSNLSTVNRTGELDHQYLETGALAKKY